MDFKEGTENLTPAQKKRELLKLLLSNQSQGLENIDIAIVGVSGRYPMAENIMEYWENLKNGRHCISEIPVERWRNQADQIKKAIQTENSYPKWGGFIKDVDKFDPLFFRMSPKETIEVDPQERLFLEVAWEALEDAGITYQKLNAKDNQVGVFVGVMNNDYVRIGGKSAYWSIANRISYFFNFQGPSLSVDSACSASLTAIHLACESIKRGECRAAVAGGVNLILHPTHVTNLFDLGMLSSDDKCKAFGAEADGFVDGEGIGAILIKTLDDAIKDRDRIYGVIKGTAINAGGRTSGYTVPNPNAQGKLIVEALKRSRINPRTISYLEAHGTGTSLGDPIEIAGLSNAYNEFTKEKQYCSIGSVKANIGHLESAAGIAGLTKVLLQMQHKQLVPSLHSEKLNPKIDFVNSPFYVQKELSNWERITIVEGDQVKVYPRRAGISSFGAGGANAHIIIEEYESSNYPYPDNNLETPYGAPHLVVISAKNKESMRAYVKKMLEFLGRAEIASLESDYNFLADMAYTLQVGREALDERLAVIVSNLQDLRDKFSMFELGQGNIDGLYQGNIKSHEEKYFHGMSKEFLEKTITSQEDKVKIAKLWVNGVEIDWSRLYPNHLPNRIALPTYSFLRKKLWIEDSEKKRKISEKLSEKGLHPLIYSNTSSLKEQKYTTPFNGQEFFLKDHSIAGKYVLPGVTYLEMACFAGELAKEQKVKKLKNITWLNPFIFSHPTEEVNISFYPTKEFVDYEVWKSCENENRIVFSQGKIIYESFESKTVTRELLDIELIKERCFEVKTGEECYREFNEKGYSYGPSLQGIKELFINANEALANIQLPKELESNFSTYKLHPSLLDGALQTVFGLLNKQEKKLETLYLPFSMGEIEILGCMSKECYSHVTYCSGDQYKSERLEELKFNITLTNNQGDVVLRIKEFTLRPFKDTNVIPVSQTNNDTLYFQSIWEESKLKLENLESELIDSVLIFDIDKILFDTYSKHHTGNKKPILIMPGKSYCKLDDGVYELNPESYEDFQQLITALQINQSTTIIHNWSREYFTSEKDLDTQLNNVLFSLVHLCKLFSQMDKRNRLHLLYLYNSNNLTQPHYAAVGAFLKSFSIENSNFTWKTIELKEINQNKKTGSPNQLECVLLDEISNKSETEVRYRGNQRFVKRLTEVTKINQIDRNMQHLRENGVYIITGGAGELGLIVAQYLTKEVKAHLVLVGRSELTVEQRQKIHELENEGGQVLYIRGDIAKKEEVAHIISKTKANFIKINGIIHCAGVKKDAQLVNKTKEDIKDVIAPKVFGAYYLDELTKDEPLDFFVFFSSLAAEIGNVGQCDYAYCNSFIDNYSQLREEYRLANQRSGKTVSINWPLWEEGGMSVDEHTKRFFNRTIGLSALDNDSGLKSFEVALNTSGSQLIVVAGNPIKINRLLKIGKTQGKVTKDNQGEAVNQIDNQLFVRIQRDLIRIIGEVSEIQENEIDVDDYLSEFGFDSITFTKLANNLNEYFRLEITPAAFFGSSTLNSIANYLYEEQKDNILNFYQSRGDEEFGGNVKPQKENDISPNAETEQKVLLNIKPRFITNCDCTNNLNLTSEQPLNTELDQKITQDKSCEEIAIIGMSGIMPQSDDLESFWQNLVSGLNLVTEIPQSRWDWREYYGNPSSDDTKTNIKWGGFMNEVDKFDAQFFKISPREAELMDPQERLALEIVWKTIEDAGYKASQLAGSNIGVFAGVATADYKELLIKNNIPIGSTYSILANRLSYFFDFKGPSEPIDSACSSSLVAVHRAVETIQTGNCDMAIVCGINVIVNPNLYIVFSKSGMLAEDGKCKTFDKRANGYVRGEGVGAVLLKPLRKAQMDGDHIYAIIKGTAVNHGGHTSSFSVPSADSQSDVIIKAYENAQIDPSTVTYIETHGTGTSLGDPIEIEGLKKAFKYLYKKWNKNLEEPHCMLGAVKTNIGHLEAASGIASLLKVLLALKYKKLTSTIHYEELNPHIKLGGSPFFILNKTIPWMQLRDKKNMLLPRRAGISSFGIGGVNAHVVLEEYSQSKFSLPETDEDSQIIVLSARNKEALRAYAKNTLSFLEKNHNVTKDVPFDEEAHLTIARGFLLNTLSRIIGINERDISLEEDLAEQSCDQIALTKLANEINEYLNCDISLNSISGYRTLNKLANALVYEYHSKGNQPNGITAATSLIDHKEPNLTLRNMAYTLQCGREEMEERLAIVVVSLQDLINKLSEYCQGTEGICGIYQGSAELSGSGSNGNKLLESFDLEKLVSEKDLCETARRWAAGAKIDWTLLYHTTPKRISLPTYPFLKHRYWFDSYLINTNKRKRLSTTEKDIYQNQREDYSKEVMAEKSSYNGNEVILKIIGDIALIVMQDKNNKNMFSEGIIKGLMAKFQEIKELQNIKAVIVTGYDNVFCMGGTQEELSSIIDKKAGFKDIPFLYRGFLECDVPVIAAIQGHSVGGGLVFGLFADIVVMSESGIYSANFMKYGFTPGLGGTYILKEKLGNNLANLMMFTAQSYSGSELKDKGAPLIFKKSHEVLSEAILIAKMLSEKPRYALQVLKKELSGRILEKLSDIIDKESRMHEETFYNPEVKKRVNYYFSKTSLGSVSDNIKENEQFNLKQLKNKPLSNSKETISLPTTKHNNLEKIPSSNHETTVEKYQAEENIRKRLVEIFSRIIHLKEDEINLKASFKDLGVDSIIGVEIVREINSYFGINLEAIVLYDYSTINKLAMLVYQETVKEPSELQINELRNDNLIKFNDLQENQIGNSKLKLKVNPERQIYRETKDVYAEDQSKKDIKTKIVSIINKILHNSNGSMNSNLSFKDLGVDSIIGVEIVRELNNCFKVNLETTVLYDYSTINMLTEFIYSQSRYERAQQMDISEFEATKFKKIVLKPMKFIQGKTTAEVKEEQFITNQPRMDKYETTLTNSQSVVYKSRETISEDITNILRPILHHAGGINPNISFKDLGVDSIIGVEIIREINNHFFLNLEATVLYDYATINKLSELIAFKLKENQVNINILDHLRDHSSGKDLVHYEMEEQKPNNYHEAQLLQLLKKLQSGEMNVDDVERLTEGL